MISSLLATFLVAGISLAATDNSSLLVDDAPSYVRAYILPYLTGTVYQSPETTYRFPITSLSSGGAFTFLTTNIPAGDTYAVTPHYHTTRYENFFTFRGQLRFWVGDGPGGNNSIQNVRDLRPGDMCASPPNTTHTFQALQPETELYGVTFPAGLEDFFYSFLNKTEYPTSTPYIPFTDNSLNVTLPNANVSSDPADYDLIYEEDYVPRNDTINGQAPANSGWHTENNVFPSDENTPFYMAQDYAPRYLNSEYGYQIIQTYNQKNQTEYFDTFTVSFIAMEKRAAADAKGTYTFDGPSGFRIEFGAMYLQVEGYEGYELMYQGDIAFIPGNTSFSYYSTRAFTKVLYFSSGGNNTLDATLVNAGESYEDYWTWPAS